MRITIGKRQEYVSTLEPILQRWQAPDWAWLLIEDADRAYVAGAYYACLMISINALEKFLRLLHDTPERKSKSFNTLIYDTEMPEGLRRQLRSLKEWRSAWFTRSTAAWEARVFLREDQLESFAAQSIKLLRQSVRADASEYEHLVPSLQESFRALLETSLGGWRITRFRKEEPDSGETVIDEVWDHTHCSFCFGAIRDKDRALTDGCFWVCNSCFDSYGGNVELDRNNEIAKMERIATHVEQAAPGDADKPRA